MAEAGSALRRLSRQGMGRAGIRRPRTVRETDARRFPGRAFRGSPSCASARIFAAPSTVSSGENRALSAAQDRGVDAGCRHRAQPRQDQGAVSSARAWLEIMESGPGFSNLLWDLLDGRPKLNNFRPRNRCRRRPRCRKRCRRSSLRAGSSSCGPTIVYAFMQAVGMVNDHLVACHRHAECAKLARRR